MPIESIVTPVFRVSYPHLDKPQVSKGKDPSTGKFSVTMLFPKTTDISTLKANAKAALLEKFGTADRIPKGFRNPFRDGDTDEINKGKEGYAGHVFVTATSKTPVPILKHSAKTPQNPKGKVRVENPLDVYPGCYAIATIKASWYDMEGNRGVKFFLNNLLLHRDGEPLGSRGSAEDDLGDIPPEPGSIPGDDADSISIEEDDIPF